MKEKIELHKLELELLNQQLAKIEAERDCLQKEVQAIRSSQMQNTSRGQWRSFTVATVSVLAVISLSFVSVYHDALSNVNKNDPLEHVASGVLEAGQIVRAKNPSANDKKPPRSSKQKTRFAKAKKASQRQWGPLLVMPETNTKKRYYGFDPVVKAQQKNLLTLGFNVGKADGYKGTRTRQAIAEFRALYLPDSGNNLQDADLAVIIENYANLARSDAALHGVDHGVVAAIRLSSVRTAVDFTYLMKLAATESNFKPRSQASTSSATGLYQFTHDTWLNTLKKHGAKYGLVADYAASIEYRKTRSGFQRPIVRNQKVYKHLLALRKNPRLSAMMAAETVHDNQQKLASLFDREPTETDLYLTHFLGTAAAITFLQSMEKSPASYADELFPMAASSNRDIFHPRTCAPRTLDEVYAHFGKKFSTKRYSDYEAIPELWLAKLTEK